MAGFRPNRCLSTARQQCGDARTPINAEMSHASGWTTRLYKFAGTWRGVPFHTPSRSRGNCLSFMERSAKRVIFIDMSNQIMGNYLKIHRRRCGLSQRELGRLIGYESEGQVRRHERSKTTPPLLIAIAYEVVFQVPVSAIFVGFQSTVARVVETNLDEFRKDLQRRSAEQRLGGTALQKMQWLTERPTR